MGQIKNIKLHIVTDIKHQLTHSVTNQHNGQTTWNPSRSQAPHTPPRTKVARPRIQESTFGYSPESQPLWRSITRQRNRSGEGGSRSQTAQLCYQEMCSCAAH